MIEADPHTVVEGPGGEEEEQGEEREEASHEALARVGKGFEKSQAW